MAEIEDGTEMHQTLEKAGQVESAFSLIGSWYGDTAPVLPQLPRSRRRERFIEAVKPALKANCVRLA